MAFEENNSGMVMPVQPIGGYGGGYGYGVPFAMPYGVYGNGNGGCGCGFGGDWGAWIILFLFAMFGFGGMGGMNGFGGMGGMFPWLLAGQAGINANTNTQFDTAGLSAQISAVQTSLNNAEVANCNRTIDSLQTAYGNQIADLNRSFDSQTAITAGQTALASQLAECCCENRLATANLSAKIASEDCLTRDTITNGIRDVITSQTAGFQRILDQMCNDKIDAKNEKISELQNIITMKDLAASQTAQTAALIANNNEQSAYLVNRIAPFPSPSYIVGNPYVSTGYGAYGYTGYGCGTTNFGGCGCGC